MDKQNEKESKTPLIKQSVRVSYDQFCEMYNGNEWIKIGSWKLPMLALDVFWSSALPRYFSKYGITGIQPVKYLLVGADVYVSHNELRIIRENLLSELSVGKYGFIRDLDKRLEVARDELDEEITLLKVHADTDNQFVVVIEKLLTVLTSFEILRDLSNVLEELIQKRFEELNIAPVPLPELLMKDRQTDLFKFHEEIKNLRHHGYTQSSLTDLESHFGYLKQYFLSGEGYTCDDIKKMIETPEGRNEEETEHHVWKSDDPELSNLIEIMNRFAIVRLLNNEVANRTMYALRIPLQKISQKASVTYEDLIKLPLSDLFEVMNNKEVSVGKTSDPLSVAMISADKNYFLSEDSFVAFKNEFFSLKQNQAHEIRGMKTYKGVVRGRVKIIIDDSDFSKFQDNDVLVCSMTDPNLVPLMKKAVAFVTDMGGILCHAAILSRELKKPCIIGTKIATQVLKDGDLVEVDADNGVVRVISRVI